MIRVLIVDDHQLVRQGVSALLTKARDIQIIGEARDGREALESADHILPDVVLMDIEMPRMDGLRATTELVARHPSTKVLILSMRSDESVIREAKRVGARGYLFKNSNREELISAIRIVSQGGRYCSPEFSCYFE